MLHSEILSLKVLASYIGAIIAITVATLCVFLLIRRRRRARGLELSQPSDDEEFA